MMKVGSLAKVQTINEGVVDSAKSAAKTVAEAPGKAYNFIKHGVDKVGNKFKNYMKRSEDYQKAAIQYGEDLKKFDDNWDKKNQKIGKDEYGSRSIKYTQDFNKFDKSWNKKHAELIK